MQARDNDRFGAKLVGLIAVGLCSATLLGGCATDNENTTITHNMPSASDAAFELGEEREPTAATLYSLAHILKVQGREAEAGVVLQRITRRFPSMRLAFLELAEMRMRQGAVDDAIAVLTEGIAANPRDPVLFNDRGMAWLMKSGHEQALADFTKASEIMPDEPRYTANKALALGMLGRYEECLETYEQIVLPARAHYNLAVVCEARNDTDRAEVEYAIAQELDPKLKRKDPATGNDFE